MKKMFFLILSCIVLLFGLSSIANALDWYATDLATLGWTAVTSYEDGRTITGIIVGYRVYKRAHTSIEPVEIGATQELQFDIELTPGEKVFVGVAAEVPGISLGDIAWSDNKNDVLNGKTFGMQYSTGQGHKPQKPLLHLY